MSEYKVIIPNRINWNRIKKQWDSNNTRKFTEKDKDVIRCLINLFSKIWNKEDYFVTLHSNILKSFCDNYKPYLNCLEACDMIIIDKHYIVDVKSRRYGLNPKILDGNYRKEYIKTNKCLIKNMLRNDLKFYEEIEGIENSNKEVYERLKNVLPRVSVRYDDAIEYVNGLFSNDEINSEQHYYYTSAIEDINNSRFFYTVCDYNRLHTNLTCLKSTLREFLYFDWPDEQLDAWDLANSQHQILSLFNTEYIDTVVKQNVDEELYGIVREFVESDEFPKYQELSLQGKLYDYFAEKAIEMGLKKTDKYVTMRDEIKDKMMIYMFSDAQHEHSKQSKVAKVEFPMFRNMLLKLKKLNRSKELAHLLQRVEAHFVLELWATSCLDEGIDIITIHDSLMFRGKDKNEVENILHNVCLDNDLPILKIK